MLPVDIISQALEKKYLLTHQQLPVVLALSMEQVVAENHYEKDWYPT